jgi:hypothetical protein
MVPIKSGSLFWNSRYFLTIRQGTFGLEEYRAYVIGNDGHFSGFALLVCADDVEAIAKATRIFEEHDIELWSGPRLVVRIERKPKSAW